MKEGQCYHALSLVFLVLRLLLYECQQCFFVWLCTSLNKLSIQRSWTSEGHRKPAIAGAKPPCKALCMAQGRVYRNQPLLGKTMQLRLISFTCGCHDACMYHAASTCKPEEEPVEQARVILALYLYFMPRTSHFYALPSQILCTWNNSQSRSLMTPGIVDASYSFAGQETSESISCTVIGCNTL